MVTGEGVLGGQAGDFCHPVGLHERGPAKPHSAVLAQAQSWGHDCSNENSELQLRPSTCPSVFLLTYVDGFEYRLSWFDAVPVKARMTQQVVMPMRLVPRASGCHSDGTARNNCTNQSVCTHDFSRNQ